MADLVLRDSGVSPEFRNIRVGTPSALSPLVWLDRGEVETYIDSTFTRGDHVKVRFISIRIIRVTARFHAIIFYKSVANIDILWVWHGSFRGGETK